MLYSAFLFSGEKEILKLRLEEGRNIQIKHVLVEADHTFSGKPKEMLFDEHDPYYSQFDIEYIQVYDMPNNGDPWKNEIHQRNAIMRGLQECDDDDIVIISDLDEIPRSSSIHQYRPEYGMSALQLDMYSFFLNLRQGRQSWNMSRIMPYSYLKETTPQKVRHSGFLMTLYEGGWHMTYMGGIDKVLQKFAWFSHQEESTQRLANRELLLRKMKDGESLWGNDKWEFIPINDTMPVYLQLNQEEFKHMIK